jgi:membrane protein implicated in regulation of membrane protease activity
MNNSRIPVTKNLTLSYALSLAVALLMTGVSLAGLLSQRGLYPTEELRRSFVSNDVVNLFIGLPILLGSMWLTRRGRLVGLLFWPGALFYVTYNYIAYAVAVSFTLQFVAYLVLVLLSVYVMFRLLSSMDTTVIQQKLLGAVPERFAGGVLVGLSSLFFLRAVGQVVNALTGQSALSEPELGVLVADLLIMPACVVGGVLLWRQQAFGYVTGVGLLFQASMLFIGLLVFFILQPFLTASPFPVDDFVVVFVMGLVCFVPFGLSVRGVLSSDSRV